MRFRLPFRRRIPASDNADIVFVISEYNRGWVLETICRQIARHWPATSAFVWTRRNRRITAPIPPARVYWFSHFQLLLTALEQNPEVRAGRLMVWYTHPSKPEIPVEQLVAGLNQCHAVIFTCSLHRDEMLAQGVRPEIAHVVLGAADPEVFKPLPGIVRDRIGFVGAYYERKNPELMEAIVRAMPEHRFLLVGPKPDTMGRTERMWTNYPGFGRLTSFSNLEYVEADYKDYPSLYNRIKVLVSTSRLEGGPISLIEGLFSGCIPVATDTGFARDVIPAVNGDRGVLSLDATSDAFCTAINYALQTDLNCKLGIFSWNTFVRKLRELSQAHACVVGSPDRADMVRQP